MESIPDSTKVNMSLSGEFRKSTYIIHTVSLQTLIDRGFGIENFINEHGKPFPSDRLKDYIALNYLFPPAYGNGLGLNLELMVKRFGARAPVFNIAWQFINDCQFHLSSLCY